jgi:hypothetical protein
MATDHATPVETDAAEPEPTAYISPAADFLILAAVTAAVAFAGVAVMLP